MAAKTASSNTQVASAEGEEAGRDTGFVVSVMSFRLTRQNTSRKTKPSHSGKQKHAGIADDFLHGAIQILQVSSARDAAFDLSSYYLQLLAVWHSYCKVSGSTFEFSPPGGGFHAQP